MNLFYVTDIFPAISEIFVDREIAALEARGTRIGVLAMIRLPVSFEHELSRKLRASRHYAFDLHTGKILTGASHLRYLVARPVAYACTLYRSRTRGLPAMGILFRQLPLICNLIRSAGAGRIHCHHGRTGMLAGWLASRLLRLPFSVTIHGSDVLVSPYPGLARVLRDADLVVCVSEKIRSQVCTEHHVCAEKTALIRCGISLAQYRFPAELPKELRILCVARLDPIKGVSLLVRACALLRDAGVDFACSIVGDGEEKEELEGLIDAQGLRDMVKLHGALPNEVLPELYARHSVFVLPSYSEGLGVVLMEAMACGLPVVASRVGGIPEIVTDQVNGFLVEPGKPDQIATAIRRVAALDEGGLNAMRRRNRLKIEQEFNGETEAAKLHALFSRGQERPFGVIHES